MRGRGGVLPGRVIPVGPSLAARETGFSARELADETWEEARERVSELRERARTNPPAQPEDAS